MTEQGQHKTRKTTKAWLYNTTKTEEKTRGETKTSWRFTARYNWYAGVVFLDLALILPAAQGIKDKDMDLV